MTDEMPCPFAWAEKVSKSKAPRYTDASRSAANYILSTRSDLITRQSRDKSKLRELAEMNEELIGRNIKLMAESAKLVEALRKIAKPALGGKEQQYIAQQTLAEYEASAKGGGDE